ncbi:hypothetical protein Daus18300_012860 [Diaporthe australafricana]|uniref:F-box domain-containing protein n=1 Tax=Diaporthe australafricana TaxID=127596 RepID=A0ABR3W185_9PEZI
MPIGDLLKSIEGLSSIEGLRCFPRDSDSASDLESNSSDEDYFTRPQMSDDDSFVTAPEQAEKDEPSAKPVMRPKPIAINDLSIGNSILGGHLYGFANQSHLASVEGYEGDDEYNDKYNDEDLQESGEDYGDKMEAYLERGSISDTTAAGTPAALSAWSASNGHREDSIRSDSESYVLSEWITVQDLDSMHQDSIEDNQTRRTVITLTHSSSGKVHIHVRRDINTASRVQNTTPEVQNTTPQMQNEGLKDQMSLRNPWRTMARFRSPATREGVRSGSRFPLECLPAELLLIVAEFLPIESAACLALACKATYSALGTSSFKMPKANRWNFLLLIEDQRPNSYACCVCLKLHRTAHGCFDVRPKCILQRRQDTSLPRCITSGLVKLTGRKYMEDPQACQEYLSWATMAGKKTTRYIKLSTHVISRMISGNFLLRTETYVHPFHNGNLTARSLMELDYMLQYDNGHMIQRLPPLCFHQNWSKYLTNLTLLKDCVETTTCTGEDTYHLHKPKCYTNQQVSETGENGIFFPINACFLFHDQPCQSCKPGPDEICGGEIQGCSKCCTDFSVSAREVAGAGLCLVLSSWKDIGGIAPGEDAKWDNFVNSCVELSWNHIDNPKGMRKESEVGRVYMAYENVAEDEDGHSLRYRPQPDWKMARDLTRRVEKRRRRGSSITDTSARTVSEDDDEDGSW